MSADLLKNPFLVAPMAGITTMPFRRLMRRMGAGAVISEFVSAHAIAHAPTARTERYLAFHEDERPVGIQLFGGDSTILAKAAQIVEARGADFVDLNLGCPVPKVTKKGGGSAWLCQPVELGRMLAEVKAAIRVPLTIKIRLGWDSQSKNAAEIIRIAKEEGVHWVAIHGRTRMQGYSGSADWQMIQELAAGTDLPLIGNGDLVSGPLAAARLLQSGCAGVMIGRGALKNPWIFQEAREALCKTEGLSPAARAELIEEVTQRHALPSAGELSDSKDYYTRKVKKLQPLPVSFVADWIKIRVDRDPQSLIEMHLALLRESYPEERVRLHFRKFLAWYAAGYPGASQFRKYIFTHDNFDDVIAKSLEFFAAVKQLGIKADEQREYDPLFSSGHG